MVPEYGGADIPFVGTVFGPYVGYRVYEYDGRTSPRILSPYKDFFEWFPNRSSWTAGCVSMPPREGCEAPEEKHTCGYYMHYRLEDATRNAYVFHTARPRVCEFVALVAAWGKVIHHESGLRSSEMEILAFRHGPHTFDADLRQIASEMRVPYLKHGELEELAKESGVEPQ